uniref:MIF4G domain-containing protein n=1 Tax=Romanomermis culicivorax TaxID=13658 RepID=A0A915J3V8_ROMCU
MEINHSKFNQRRLCCARFLGELYNYRLIDSNIIFHFLYSLVTFGVTYDHNVPSSVDPPEHLFRIRLEKRLNANFVEHHSNRVNSKVILITLIQSIRRKVRTWLLKACVCLETCGEYFDRGLSKRKLDVYLNYLQKYYWFKKSAKFWDKDEKPFPIEIIGVTGWSAQRDGRGKGMVGVSTHNQLNKERPKHKVLESYEEAVEAVQIIEEDCRTKFVIFSIDSSDPENKDDVMIADSYDDVDVRVHSHAQIDESLQIENEAFNAEYDRYLNECLSGRVQEQHKAPAPDFAVPLISKARKQTRFGEGY